MSNVTPAEVRVALQTRREIGFFDLREEAPFAAGHPLFAAQMALGRLEMEVFDRVPRRDALIVLYDDGEGLIEPATRRLEALGYDNVRALEGGLTGWRQAGYELFQDVNSYSKAFGELVEARKHTPSVSASELQRLLDEGADVAVCDARRYDEYVRMSIPTGTSVPGAELVLRAQKLARSNRTRIVVNCAGRTRSIIGAQSLINAGIPHPVAALRNGAIGWTLAGQTLDSGQSGQLPQVTAADMALGRARGQEVAYRAGVRWLDSQSYSVLTIDKHRTLYRFDVRTPEEYAEGHLAGFRSAPGGQLVQETDMFAPVRGARVVIAQDQGGRAEMTASWLAQMGWEVYVRLGTAADTLETGSWRPSLPPLPSVPQVDPARAIELHRLREATFVDVGSSAEYRAAHVPDAWFALRTQLPDALDRLPPQQPLVITSRDGLLARFAADDIRDRAQVFALAGGTDAWRAAGGGLETGLTHMLMPPLDIYKRPYEGTDHSAEAMQGYLDWEYGLVDQLSRDATHGFFVI